MDLNSRFFQGISCMRRGPQKPEIKGNISPQLWNSNQWWGTSFYHQYYKEDIHETSHYLGKT